MYIKIRGKYFSYIVNFNWYKVLLYEFYISEEGKEEIL